MKSLILSLLIAGLTALPVVAESTPSLPSAPTPGTVVQEKPFIGWGKKKTIAGITYPFRHPKEFVIGFTFPMRHPLEAFKGFGNYVEQFQSGLNAFSALSGPVTATGVLIKKPY